MINDFMESPEQMAAYLTDNAFLQRYYVQFLSIKDDAERKFTFGKKSLCYLNKSRRLFD